MKGCTRALTLTAILSTSSGMAFADEFDPFFEILIFGGVTNVNATDTHVKVSDSDTDKFVQSNDNDWNAWTAQLGVGYVYPLTDELSSGDVQWFPIINPQLNVYYLGNADIHSDVYLYGMDEYDFMDSAMDYDSTRLMFDLGLTIAQIDQFSVYALAGAGIAWNNVNLNATPNQEGIDCGIYPYSLNDNNSTSFAYEFGGGVTYAASDRVAISLEYLYAGINDVKLGSDTSSDFDLEGSSFDVNSQSVLLGLRFAI